MIKQYLLVFLLFFLFSALQASEPPQVIIIDPQNESLFDGKQITVRYVVIGSTPETVRILIDGRAIQLIIDAKIGENTVVVDIPDRDFELSIVARNEFGQSQTVSRNLFHDNTIIRPSLYILAIGIGNYVNPELRLQFSAKDASDFTQAMIRQAGLLYESVDVRLLTDRRATAENIRDGLEWLQTQTTHQDIAMLYMAGHGINNNVGEFFFMPANADIDRINATCVSYSDIRDAISAVAGKILVFMDANHSGNIFGNQQQRSVALSQAINEIINADNAPVIFNSSTGRQFSLESSEWNNGAFTKALVEGLNGDASFGANAITVKGLDLYITNRVRELTQGRQAPVTIIPQSIPDFPIALLTNNTTTPTQQAIAAVEPQQQQPPIPAPASQNNTTVSTPQTSNQVSSDRRGTVIGIRAGANLTKIDKNLDFDNITMRPIMKPAFQLGVVAIFPIGKERFSLQTGAFFAQQRTEWKGNFLDSYRGIDIEYRANAEMNLNFLKIPVNFLFLINRGNMQMFFQWGSYIGYGLGGKGKMEIYANSSIFETPFTESNEVPIDSSGRIYHVWGLGTGLMFKNKIQVNADYNFSLGDIGNGGALSLTYLFGI